ncbi:DUF4265 domain-containing protein [Streptomyces sp. AK02-01A]|uniref:DUF4265 domain-containing protein n=1 Tax=Streptomyces sp. AK02-01A TaxID=3028648 RepID=UPI0029BD2AE9|nr:DUF4265 domain-containing protein [Streptomyces sp. AK02-01A]MDX3853286.1 DUF4265 domain-containing protein [Streptomyces sp. AK02-01A]
MPVFIVHDEPVGRAQRNYIAHADLAPFGLDGQMEQLWLKPLNDGTFSIACIPFCTYGLALGDHVVLSEDEQVSEVVGLSQHRVLRMLLAAGPDPERVTEATTRIKTEIDAAGLLSEWNGDRHVAVDVPPQANPSKLFAAMEREVAEAGAFWEWADAMPFSSHH